jgi:biotin carboxyl carrier protein
MTYAATVDGKDFLLDIDGSGVVTVDGRGFAVDLRPIDDEHLYSLILDNESFELFVERREGVYYVLLEGDQYAVDVEDARLKQLRAMGDEGSEEDGAAVVVAPMPGLVVRVLVEPGQAVAEDQGLLILEAMKMENEIRTPRAGVVKVLNISDGQTVNPGETLAVVGEPDG